MIFYEREESENKIKKGLLLQENFRNGNMKIKFISASDETTDKQLLVKIKSLFQKQLSKMPRGYILRQVFDKKHITLVILNTFDAIIGAICYRPFYHKHFIEIVFCAVDHNYQIKGIGSFMMDVLKENIKKDTVDYIEIYKSMFNAKYDQFDIENDETMTVMHGTNEIGGTINEVLGIVPYKNKHINDLNELTVYEKLPLNIYLITYADNSAIGYFKKQGFTAKLSFTDWIGHIKDYEGGTIMQSKVFWDVDYIHKYDLIKQMKDKLYQVLETDYGFNKTYSITDYSRVKSYRDIPGVDSTMSIGEDKRNRNNCLNGFIDLLISELTNDPSSWPFLEPVNAKDVPEYYEVIKNPIDLSKISKKFVDGVYKDLNLFISDIHLMLNNCYKFNSRETEYYKCALRLNDKLENKLKIYEMQIRKWGLKE